MEKHSYLMLLDSDHTVLNTLKQFIEMQSSSKTPDKPTCYRYYPKMYRIWC